MIRRFLGALLDRGIAKRSVARKLACLRSFFRYLEKRGGRCRQSDRARCHPAAGAPAAAVSR